MATWWGWNQETSWGRPVQLYRFAEWNTNHGRGPQQQVPEPEWGNQVPYSALSHDRGFNGVYMDGHAKYIMPRPCDAGFQLDSPPGYWNFWWFNGYDQPANMYFMCP